jgi:uncharacterized protein (DUF983 family)
MKTCKSCGSEMVQKSRKRLLAVGVLMVIGAVGVRFSRFLWVPAIVLALTGVYLIVWAGLGRGYWCRTCKRFAIL